MSQPLKIVKTDDSQQLVFGWANVAVAVDGQPVVDLQDDIMPPAELEKAAYGFVLDYRATGVMHKGGAIGTLIESFMVTPSKLDVMGLAKDAIQPRWWVGFKIHDAETFAKVKRGELSMFSIQGRADRIEVAA